MVAAQLLGRLVNELPMDHQDFETLGLEPGADQASIRRAYTKLLRKYKPDRNPEQFARVRRAYENLKDGEHSSHGPAYRTPTTDHEPESEAANSELVDNIEELLLQRRPDLALAQLQESAWSDDPWLQFQHTTAIRKLALACVWMAPDLLGQIHAAFGSDWEFTAGEDDPINDRFSLKRAWFLFLHDYKPSSAFIDLIELAPVLSGQRALALVRRFAKAQWREDSLPNSYLASASLLSDYVLDQLHALRRELIDEVGLEPAAQVDGQIEQDQLDVLWKQGWRHQEYVLWGLAALAVPNLVYAAATWDNQEVGRVLFSLLYVILLWAIPLSSHTLLSRGDHKQGWRAVALDFCMAHRMTLDELTSMLRAHPRRRARWRAGLLEHPMLRIQELLNRLAHMVDTPPSSPTQAPAR